MVTLIFEGFKHGSFTLVGLVFREIPWISISRPKKSLVGPAIGPGPLSKRLWRDQGRDPRSDGQFWDTPNVRPNHGGVLPPRCEFSSSLHEPGSVTNSHSGDLQKVPGIAWEMYIFPILKMGGDKNNPPAMLGTTGFLVALY